ncbi:MAG: hypothetical protein AB1631_29925 [Acidobacteriota bacterium]
MKWKPLHASLSILAAMLAISAQTSRPAVRQSQPPTGPRSEHRAADQDIELPAEMRARIAIERAEDEHRRFVNDVNKLDELSTEVAKNYREKNSLSTEDMKKLGSIEKLAKKVLSHAGGSAVADEELRKLSMPEAIERMSAAAASIKKNLMAETRHVVSATVIGYSNEIINLTQTIRRAKK